MENKSEHYFKISKQIGISYFFNILIVISQPLLIALLTRILSIEEFGIYSLLFTTVSLLSVFLRFGTAEYIKTKIPGLKEENRVKTIITILSFSLVFLLIGGIVLLTIKNPIINFLKINEYAHLWILSVSLIICIALYEIIDSYLISIKKIFLRSFLSFLIKCSWIIGLATVFVVYNKFSLNTVFIIWLFGVTTSLLLTIFFIRKEIFYFFRHKLKIDFERLKSTLKFSLPLILVIAFSFIVDSSDRYMLNYFLGKSEVALYSLAYGLVSFIIAIPIIIQHVVHPYFAEKWNLKENSSVFFNIMLKYSLIIIFPAMIGMFILRKEIIYLISGSKYIPAAPIITALLLFPLFVILTELFNKTMLLRDMIKHMIVIYFIAGVINFVFNLIFIPKIGMIAAAYSTVISYFFILLILIYFKPHQIKFDFNYLKILRILSASVLMGLIISQINLIQNWYKIGLVILGIIIYSLLLLLFKIFSKEEKDLISFALNKLKKNQ